MAAVTALTAVAVVAVAVVAVAAVAVVARVAVVVAVVRVVAVEGMAMAAEVRVGWTPCLRVVLSVQALHDARAELALTSLRLGIEARLEARGLLAALRAAELVLSVVCRHGSSAAARVVVLRAWRRVLVPEPPFGSALPLPGAYIADTSAVSH